MDKRMIACSVHLNDEERYIAVRIQNEEQLILRPSAEAYVLWVLGFNAAVACAASRAGGSDSVGGIPWML